MKPSTSTSYLILACSFLAAALRARRIGGEALLQRSRERAANARACFKEWKRRTFPAESPQTQTKQPMQTHPNTPPDTAPHFKTERPSVLKSDTISAADLLTACAHGLQLLSAKARGLQFEEFAPSTRSALSAAMQRASRSTSTGEAA